MKKSIIRILCSLLLVVSMVTLTACDKTNVKDITGIELVTEPKTQYFYGEELDLSAFELKVIYKKTEVVYKYQDIMDDITVFGYDNKKSGEQELTVTYKVTEKKNVYEGTVKFKVYVDKFKGEVAIPTNFDKVYDGKAIEVKATDYTTNSDATPSIKWYKGETEVEAPVNAGDYRLVISVAETAKFTQASIEKAVKISKQVVAAPVYTESNFSYTGSELQAVISEDSRYTIAGDKGTLAGSYKATVTLKDTANFVWAEGAKTEFDWAIAKQVVAAPVYTESNFSYTGSELTAVISEDSRYTIAGDKGTLAGSYKATVTLKDTANFVWAEGAKTEFDWVIAKQVVAAPVYTESNFSYTGSELTAVISEDDRYTISGDKATLAGSYKATVTLKDTANFVWAEGAKTEFDWAIAKQVVAAPVYTESNFSYTGSELTAVISEDSRYTIAGDKGTLAGSYKATVTLKDTANFVWAEGAKTEFDWVIAKQVVAAPVYTESNFSYTGSELQAVISTDDRYTIAGDKGTLAGSYKATVTLKDTANFVWAEGAKTEFDWAIAKQVVAAPVCGYHDGDFIYDGTLKIVPISTDERYTISGDRATDRGSYTAVVTLKDTDNFVWAEGAVTSFNWAISVATGTLVLDENFNLNKVYDNTPVRDVVEADYVKNGDGNVIVTWFVRGSEVALASKPVNAGLYTVKVLVEGTNNFTQISATHDFEISKANYEISHLVFDDKTVTFDNTAHGIEIVGELPTGLDGIQLEVSYSDGLLVVGEKNIYATFATASSNYNVPEQLVAKLTIETLLVTMPTLSHNFSVYNGVEYTIPVVYDYIWAKIAGDITVKNAKEYTATVSLKDDVNTKWDNGTTAPIEFNYEITRLQLTISGTTINEEAINENRLNFFNQSNIDVQSLVHVGTLEGVIDGDIVLHKCFRAILDSGNAGQNNVLVEYSISGEDESFDNYIAPVSENIVVNILRYEVAKPELTADDLVYNGEAQTAKISPVDSKYTISGNVKTNAGTYDAVVALNDMVNYVWSDGTNASFSITWRIDKATIPTPTSSLITDDLVFSNNIQYVKFDNMGGLLYETHDSFATNAGEYTIRVIVSSSHRNNYRLENDVEYVELKWHIAQKVVTKPVLNSDNLVYCGVPQNADIIRDTENTYFYRRASDNHQMTNAGTYHVLYKLDWNTQDVTNVVWEDGSSADVTVTYHIKKAQLSVALPQDLSITYFGGVDIRDKIGTPELLGVLGDDQVTYEITRAELWTKNVGPRDQRFAYMEFSISGTDSENYYAPAYCELPVEIKKLQLTIPIPSMNMELYESVRANNFNQTNIDVKDYIVLGALNNLVEGDDVTVKCAEATLFNGNAGPQTVIIYFDIIGADRDNYLSPKSVSFTQYIPYSKVPKPTLTSDDLVYTGEPLTAKIPTSPYYTITGNVATNAGEYTATLTFNDPDNYRWNEDTKGSIHITWHIAPQVVDKPELNTDDLVYTRSLLTADIDASELYTITNNTATDAGTYYATVALNDTSNYVWNDSLTTAFNIEFHVDKATPTIELLNSFGKSQLDKVYDGIAHSNPTEDVNFTSFSDGVLTIKWLYNESENNVSNKNVGEQILLIKYAESDNYYEKSMEISFEITQKEATLLWTQLTGEALVYNGAEKVLSASVTNLCLTDECTVNVEVVGDNVNVGTFKFKAISLSNANYKLPENVNSDNYTIIPQPVVNPAVPSPVTYNGQVQTVGIEESDLYTISNGSHKDKGNYLVTVSLNDKDNYEWMGTGNSNDITYEFVINAKSLEWKNNVDHLTIASRAYDGTRVVSLSQILWSDIELVLFDGDDVEIDKDLTIAQYNDPYSGQFKDVVVTFKVKGEQANNYDPDSLTLTVTNCEIAPKTLTVSGGLSGEYTEIVYNGETLLDKEWFEFELVGVENNEAVELDWVANLDSPEPNEAQTITIVFSISGDTSQYYTKPVNATATIKVTKATPTITFENSYFVWSPGFDEEIDEDWLPKTSYIDDYGTQSVVFYEYNEPGDEWNLHYGYSFDDQNKYKFVYSVSGSDRYTSASKEVEFYSYNVKQSIGEGMGEGGYVSSPEVTWSNDMENAIIVQFQYNGRIKDEYCDYAFKFADYDSTNGTMRIIDKFDHEIKPDQDGYYVLNTGTYYIVVECTGSFNLSNHTLFEYRQPYVAAPDPEL